MNHVSLFSGIGGFDLAAQVAGFKNCACVEIDEWCQNILKLRFPDVDIYGDITKVSGKDLLKSAGGHITVLSGGFPCQPISVAGERKGSTDERWMWNEYARIIRETKPDWVIIENSPRLYSIPEWGGVQRDLEEAGYEIQCFRVSASGVGAPHVRERACIIANSIDKPRLQTDKRTESVRESGKTWNTSLWSTKQSGEISSDTMCIRFPQSSCLSCRLEKEKSGCPSICSNLTGESADTVMPDEQYKETCTIRTPRWDSERKRSWCRDWKSRELPDWEAYPSKICRMDDGIPLRVDKPRLQALGNAIVPRVFYPFFKAIKSVEEYYETTD